MPIKIEVTVHNIEALTTLQARLKDLSPVMQHASLVLLTGVSRTFSNETDPNTGEKWQPLAATTLLERAKKRYTGSMLKRTGDLAKSVHPEHDKHSALVGTNKVYAAIHQFGGQIKRNPRTQILHFRKTVSGQYRFAKKNDKRTKLAMKANVGSYTINIPARPFLGVSRDTMEEILETLRAHILEG